MIEFEWDDANEDHVARHGVEPDEAEQALLDPRRRSIDAYRGPAGEPRRAVLGMTEDGRLLVVVFTWRLGAVRVVTARDAILSEQRSYRRRK